MDLVSIGSWRLFYQTPSLLQSASKIALLLTFRIRFLSKYSWYVACFCFWHLGQSWSLKP
jgi:hypothetical protein